LVSRNWPLATKLLCDAEEAGFEVHDVESLREHYALTLRHWDRRLQDRLDEARSIVGERTCRVWRLFLCGSAQTSSAGTLNVYQSLLIKPDQGRSGLPLTRAGWYSAPATPPG
jgi:cyclopropane-fatty-acyl-phospholipid synthase